MRFIESYVMWGRMTDQEVRVYFNTIGPTELLQATEYLFRNSNIFWHGKRRDRDKRWAFCIRIIKQKINNFAWPGGGRPKIYAELEGKW